MQPMYSCQALFSGETTISTEKNKINYDIVSFYHFLFLISILFVQKAIQLEFHTYGIVECLLICSSPFHFTSVDRSSGQP